MKIITNHKLIKRNARIGQVTTIGALMILGIGLFITFKFPDKAVYSLACLMGGFVLSQVGIHFGNRWGRSPRPDEIINKNMKGMGREYTIYHFTTPAAHMLLGPAGVWIIRPYYQGGNITYSGKRWRSSGGGFSRSYLRLFGQESMGRPDLEAESEIRAVTRFLEQFLPSTTKVPIVKVAMLFTDPKVELKVDDAPIPALKPDKLKDLLKMAAKENPLPDAVLKSVREVLPRAEDA